MSWNKSEGGYFLSAPIPGTGAAPAPAPPGAAARRPIVILVIVGATAAFAGGFFTGSFFPLGDDGGVAIDPDPAAVEEEVPAPDATGTAVDAGDPAGELVAVTPNTTGPAGDSDPAAPTFFPYTLADYGTGPCAPAEGAAEAALDFADAPALCIDVTAAHTATFDTSRGIVRVALDAQNMPGTVNNFVNLARFGYYDGTLIHRSDPSIGILQGGSPHTNDAGDPGPGYLIWDEGSGFTYRPGQLVMARTTGPNSADAQFFFTVTDAAALLDGQGTSVVFGEVIAGLDVLADILDSHLTQPGNDFGGAPDPPVIINSVTIETQGGTSAPPTAVAGPGGLFYYPYALGDYGTGPCAPTEGVAEPVLDFADAPVLCIDVTATHTATFDTSRGTVRVALDAANVPGTVNSFVNLARFGYYDGTLIHRSDPSIGILQGGSPHTDEANDPGPGYQLLDEGAGFSYVPGQLVMARTAGPNSADAQFFFTVTDAAALLDGQGTSVVFGEVVEGLDVLTDILDSHLAQPGNDFGGAPDPPVTINSVTIETQGGTNPPIVPADSGGLFYYPYAPGDYGTGPCAPTDVTEPVLDFADAPMLCIDATGAYEATFDTSRGTVRVALDAANVPGTVNSFVNLARFGYYEGTLIHRSDPGIGILQGGSPHTDEANDPGPGYRVLDEGAGFSYVPGQIAMARTAGPDSADAQFFFTVTDAAALLDGQGTYVVFGEVVEGLDVLTDILDSHLDEPGNDFGGAPDPPVIINSVTIESQGAADTSSPAEPVPRADGEPEPGAEGPQSEEFGQLDPEELPQLEPESGNGEPEPGGGEPVPRPDGDPAPGEDGPQSEEFGQLDPA